MDGPRLRPKVFRFCPLVVLALLASGWLVIARSEQLTDGPGRLLRQQIVWSILGFGVLAAASRIDYRRLIRASFLAYTLVLVALVAVYCFPAVNGAQRWIRIAGVGIQPSEFAKVAFIMALAAFLMHRDISAGFSTGVLWPLAMALAPLLLVLKEPDLGTSLIFLPVLFAMLFAAGARRRDLVRLAVAGIAAVAAAVGPDEPRTAFSRDGAGPAKRAERTTDRRWISSRSGQTHVCAGKRVGQFLLV